MQGFDSVLGLLKRLKLMSCGFAQDLGFAPREGGLKAN